MERFYSEVKSDISQVIPKELGSTGYVSKEFCSVKNKKISFHGIDHEFHDTSKNKSEH